MTLNWTAPFQRRRLGPEVTALLAQRQSKEAERRVRPSVNRETLAMGAPVTATFIGLLVLDQFRSGSEAEAAEWDGQIAASHAGSDQPQAGDTVNQSHAGFSSQQPKLDPGSVLSVGAEIEPGLLATISGVSNAGSEPDQITLQQPDVPNLTTADSRIPEAGGDIGFTINSLNAPAKSDDSGTRTEPEDPVGIYRRADDGGAALTGTKLADTLIGGGGVDTLQGLEGNDKLEGRGGDDVLSGGDGNDRLDGGGGVDRLEGGAGNDTLLGQDGDDRISGGAGSDNLSGGTGNDRLDGGAGDDTMAGGMGDDTYVLDHVSDIVQEDGSNGDRGGNDTVEVGSGYSESLKTAFPGLSTQGLATFMLGEGTRPAPEDANGFVHRIDKDIENLTLTGAHDHDLVGDDADNRLTGNDGDNRIHGNGGDDHLRGGAGDDVLFGDGGDDWLTGGDGADMMYGGAGDDTYLLGLNDGAVDTIFDHEGSNKIAIDMDRSDAFDAVMRGDDMVLRRDGEDAAVIKDHANSPESFTGVQFKDGFAALSDLLKDKADQTPSGDPGSDNEDWLSEFLVSNRVKGGAGDDVLNGNGSSDWLEGGAGNDNIHGGGGDDLLAGGQGSDRLKGGAGDDTYLIKAGERGIDRISDTEGVNDIRLQGFEDDTVGGFLSGGDLWITAGGEAVGIIEDYSSNSAAFGQIYIGDKSFDLKELS